MRLGCIGIGSNAIRLLTAGWAQGDLCDVRRERMGTRLFAGLVNGVLTENSIRSSVEAVRDLANIAREDGAQEIFCFATSAVRDAKNGGDFTARAEAASGVDIEIISGEEEAVLSYIGASTGGRYGVIDIGGGSTEFTLGDGENVLGAVSLQMGAVRMNGNRPILSREDYDATLAVCDQIIRDGAPDLLALPAMDSWTGVGGTMTTIGAMQRSIPLFTEETCEGMTMTLEEIADWGDRVSRMTLDERRTITGLMPHRADIIPSGIAILEAAMRAFGVREMRLSAHGNMDGYLKRRFRAMAAK